MSLLKMKEIIRKERVVIEESEIRPEGTGAARSNFPRTAKVPVCGATSNRHKAKPGNVQVRNHKTIL